MEKLLWGDVVTDFTPVEPLLRKDWSIGRGPTHINDLVGQVLQHYQDVIDRLYVERESWNKDKIQSMKGMEYGKEEASSAKLLNKHRTVEYSSNVQEISAAASELVNTHKLDAKPINNGDRDNIHTRELKQLKNMTKVYNDPLVFAIQLYGNIREMGQLLVWIREMMADASEDPRHDYELIVQLGDKDMNRVNVKCSQS